MHLASRCRPTKETEGVGFEPRDRLWRRSTLTIPRSGSESVESEKCPRSVQVIRAKDHSAVTVCRNKYIYIRYLIVIVPGGIRTPNLLIRSQKLYPVELQAL